MLQSTGSTLLPDELIRDPSPVPITSQLLVDALRYWNGQRPGPGLLPGRQHIEPTDIPKLLRCVWMLDVIHEAGQPKPRFRCRIYGGHFLDSWGPKMQGRFLDTVEDFVGSDGETDLIGVCETGIPRYYSGVPSVDPYSMVAHVEALMLPLARDGRNVDMMINFSHVRHIDNVDTSLVNR